MNFPNTIFFAASSTSALSSTIAGLFPPNSSTHGTRFLAAAYATSFPFSELPVNTIESNFFAVQALATSTAPSIHAKQLLSSYYEISFFIFLNVVLLISDGFITAQLPAAITLINGPIVV